MDLRLRCRMIIQTAIELVDHEIGLERWSCRGASPDEDKDIENFPSQGTRSFRERTAARVTWAIVHR